MSALMQKREAAIDELRTIKESTKGADFTVEQSSRVEELGQEVKNIDLQLKAATTAERTLDAIGGGVAAVEDEPKAKSIGDFYVKSAGYADAQRGSFGGRTEVKAATDIHTLEELGSMAVTERQLPLQRLPEQTTSIFQWLVPQEITEGAVKWVQETPVEGSFEIVAEGAQKPQLHFGYEPKSDTLHTAAGWFDSTVQQVRRAPQFAADINRRGVRKLLLDQERMILAGTEATDGFNGLLNTSGIGTLTAATRDEWFDRIGEAIDQAEELGEFPVNGIAINRTDWGILRRAKNANEEYIAGSPFAAGSIARSLWEVPVIVSSRIPRGTAVVGASENASVFIEPTVHVDVTNSDKDKFTKNIVTTRIEQDILFAAIRAAGFVKVTLTDAPGV